MFRFTIRELVLLTLVVGMGVGWWLRERELSAELKRAADQDYESQVKARTWQAQAEYVAKEIQKDGYVVQFGWGTVDLKRPEQPILRGRDQKARYKLNGTSP